MAKVLILGGTRNLGHFTSMALLRAGHSVTVLNRGVTPDDLPPDVERLRATRGSGSSLRDAVGGREWDVVVDTTSYTGQDAGEVLNALSGSVGKIIFISTGQVYLVRNGLRAPFRESDYPGDLIPAPPPGTSDHDNWIYGMEKRNAEDTFRRAATEGPPVVSLRLPMIASERDHYGRIQAYAARVLDGGPILLPSDNLPVRHVYVADVAELISRLCSVPHAGFNAFNVSNPKSIALAQFLELLGTALQRRIDFVTVDRTALESRNLLPGCSPYSGKWMSELDGSLSTAELGVEYIAPPHYVPLIVADYCSRWVPALLKVPGYDLRREELDLLTQLN